MGRVPEAAGRAALSRAVGDIMGLVDRVPVLTVERLHPGLAGEAPPPPE